MGNGHELKKVLEEKKYTVAELARTCNISSQTIYTIIRKDSSIRYDYALRMANALEIPVEQICDNIPYIEGVTYPTLYPEYSEGSSKRNKKSYFKHRTYKIAELYNYSEFPQIIDRLLASYYILDDEGRKIIDEDLALMAKNHTSEVRKENLSKIIKN